MKQSETLFGFPITPLNQIYVDQLRLKGRIAEESEDYEAAIKAYEEVS